MTKLKLICALLCLFAQANDAQAKVTCITKLTGQQVCTDDRTGRTYEKVDKLTGDSEWVTTRPGRSYDNDHNEHWNGRGHRHGDHED